MQHANVLSYFGQTREAIREAERAARLDPLSPDPLAALSVFYGYAGDTERSVAEARAAVALDGDDPGYLGILSQALTLAGQQGEAVETADRALQLLEDGQEYAGSDFSNALAIGVFARARAGDRVGAEALAARLDAEYPELFFQRAEAAAALGDADRAFALLGRSVATRNENLPWLGVDPLFAPYRTDPRMTSLLERIGLLPTDR